MEPIAIAKLELNGGSDQSLLDRHSSKCRLPVELWESVGVSRWGQPVSINVSVRRSDQYHPRGVRTDHTAVLLATAWPPIEPEYATCSDSTIACGTIDARVIVISSAYSVHTNTASDLPHDVNDVNDKPSRTIHMTLDEVLGVNTTLLITSITPFPFQVAESVTLTERASSSNSNGTMASPSLNTATKGFAVATGCQVRIPLNEAMSWTSTVVSTTPPSTPTNPVCIVGTTTFTLTQQHATNQPQSTNISFASPNDQTIAGLDHQFKTLCDLIRLPSAHPRLFEQPGLSCPKGILLYGPPGTGKTLLVSSVVKQCNARLTTINGPELFAPYLGESEANLRKAFAEASVLTKDGQAVVLFIDEIDAMCPRRDDNSGQENRMVAQLLTLMDGLSSNKTLVVIAATNRANVLDPALRRPGRFDREIEIPVPAAPKREQILRLCTRKLRLSDDVDIKEIANRTVGYVGADIAALVREVALNRVHEASLKASATGSGASVMGTSANTGTTASSTLRMKDFDVVLNRMVPSTQRASKVVIKETAWADIGGLQDIKSKLEQAAVWPLKYPETYSRLGISPPRGILLHGPPGCAKTTLARALASAASASFYVLAGADVLSPYLGDAEATIRALFKKARSTAPSIIFLDEIDSMVGNRSHTSDSGGVQERVLTTLLTEMDGIESAGQVLIVGATNRPDVLDTAFTRPGRIDQILYVPLPDCEARLSILQIKTSKMPLDATVDLNALALATDLFSGADLENLCREAAIGALRSDISSLSVSHRDFEKALLITAVTVTKKI
eukprot:m.147606 g.147606  ORF g.147606 m.147606 type:complete len:790 (-) comp30548_c0_seq1:75-2444(-)